MRKIRLKIESLAVESFDTGEVQDLRGTVRAYFTTPQDPCTSADDALTCARRRTDYASCDVQCECTIRGMKCHNPA